MAKGLAGKKVVIGATRKLEEFDSLITKQGGTSIVRSLQGTTFFDENQIGDDIVNFIKSKNEWCIFTTGVGIEALLNSAEKICLYDQFVSKIKESTVASRGYKSFAALKKLEITPVATDDDGTNQGLIRNLVSYEFKDKHVMVQLHGESAPRLIQFLEDQGAIVTQILPYKHIEPEVDTVEQLCQEIRNRDVDAVCFTTAIQAHCLFNYAKKMNYYDDLKEAFKEDVVAVSVGKVTSEALKDHNISRIVAPENERMGAMIMELANYYNRNI